MQKTCVICGAIFNSPPSAKKVTCSSECQRKYAKIRSTGRKKSSEVKRKIAEAAKDRNMTALQKTGTEAALKSPRSGRFETNVNAVDWHLVSPDGKHYQFHSLMHWLRENGKELFGCEPDTREFNNVRSGLCGAKRAMLGGTYRCTTYKGWQVLPTEQDKKKCDYLKVN